MTNMNIVISKLNNDIFEYNIMRNMDDIVLDINFIYMKWNKDINKNNTKGKQIEEIIRIF